MPTQIMLTKVRLSFPKLVEASAAQQTPNAEKKFGADFILPNNHPDLARFMAAVGEVAGEKWKENANVILQMCQNERKNRCYGSGNEKIDKKTLKPYVGYEGMAYITASSAEDKPPTMIRLDGTPCPNENTMERQQIARKLYGGCYVNVAVRLWAQDNSFGRAVRCELQAVQFNSDGEPFGEAPPDFTGKFGAVAAPSNPGAGAPVFPAFLGIPQ